MEELRMNYLGKELSTRNRMSTLKEALSYFENMDDQEAVNTIKAIIKQKEDKKSGKKNDKPDTDKSQQNADNKSVVMVDINSKGDCKVIDNIENYDPEETEFTDNGGIKSNLLSLAKISKDLQKQAVTMFKDEVRSCTDFYYQVQGFRMATENQLRSITQMYDTNTDQENVSLMKWNAMQLKNIEKNNKLILEKFSDSTKVTQWMKSALGIGPIISSCLYAYLNIDGINSAGNFWSYAGLNDNNNPWLGATKADQIVSDVWDIIKIIHSGYSKVCKELKLDFEGVASEFGFDEEKIYEFLVKNNINIEAINIQAREYCLDKLKTHKQFNQVDESLLSEQVFDSIEEEMLRKEIQDTTFGLINLEAFFTVEYLIDYIVHLDDNNVATSLVVQFICTKLNNRRKINSIIKGATVKKEDDKYYGLISKKSLTKYLSMPPYNRKLKVLMWKIGESFIKVSNKPGSLYGTLFKERKAYETAKNERLEYKDQAALALRKNTYNKKTVAYQCYIQGKLPQSQINERAKRYVEKIYLSHVFEAMYIDKHGMMPEMVYPISRLGHVDYIAPEVPYSNFWSYTPYDPNKVER